MKERPIVFSGPMVRAILDGRKTMTRRVVKYRAYAEQGGIVHPHECPYGQPGDRLWVRETFLVNDERIKIDPRDFTGRWQRSYPFQLAREEWERRGRKAHDWIGGDGEPRSGVIKKPSIFMPRWASRITLEITAVRVERVQDISPDDVQREGLDVVGKLPAPFTIPKMTNDKAVNLIRKVAQVQFRELWDSLNAKRGYGWDVNPWVWSISFKRLT